MNARISNLQGKLDEITAQTRQLVQAERLAVGERAVEELLVSGAEKLVLQPGSPAPQFELPDYSGNLVRLRDLLALGPLVVTFFRGRWCPYCVTELEAWRDLYAAIRERSALLVAISPQTVRQNDFTASQHSLPFPVLSDFGCSTAARYGLAYRVSQAYQKYYRSILVNIPFVNGDESWTLPIPATFVVGQDGQVLFSEAHADFKVRPEPEEVLAALPARR